MSTSTSASSKPGNWWFRLWLWLGLTDKSPWDFIQLLFLPVLFVGLSYFLNEAANERQRQDAKARFEQGVIKDYYDVITKLVLENELTESKAGQPVSDVAKAYTFNVLETVDGSKKRGIAQFLYALDLIKINKPIIPFEVGSTSGQYEFKRVGFARADLSGMYLWKVRLACADLQETNLQNASLVRSHLYSTDFRGANLRGTRLEQADLRNSLLKDADLTGADLRGANLIGAKLEGCLLSGAKFKNALYSDRTVWPQRFDPELHGAMCICPKADLRKAVLKNRSLHFADLRSADLSGADLRGARLEAAKLNGVILTGANLQGASLQRADFTGAKLDRANLKGAYVKQTVFENAVFCQTIMPNGSMKNDNCPAHGN